MKHREILNYDMQIVAESYYKVVEVNLEDDSYFIVSMDDREVLNHTCLSHWVSAFGEMGVAPEDREAFYKFFHDLRACPYEKHLIRYNRSIGGEFHDVFMESIPMERNLALLVVKVIEEC